MSHVDNYNSREKLMKKYTKSWFPHQANLIYMISKHSIIYVPLPANRQRRSKLDKAKWDDAWIEISSKLDQPIQVCKQLWSNILFKYAKIMSLINTGRITRMAAMSNAETAKYFDGRLSFMDPHLCEIGDEKIPSGIHKLINNIFHLKTKQTPKTSSSKPDKPDKQNKPNKPDKPNKSEKPDNQIKKLIITHAHVKTLLKKRELQENNDSDTMDTKSLQIVIDTAVKCKLEELLQIKNTLSKPSNDIVNKDDENAVNVQSKSEVILIPSDEENTSECITKWDLGLQSELIIKDDNDIEIDREDDEQSMEDDEQRMEDDEQRMENDEQRMEDDVDNIEMNDEDCNIIMEDEDGVGEENSVIDKNLNNETLKKVDLGKIVPIIVPGACTILGNLNDEVSDAYIKNFFKELGEVMSLELNISKQKKLKSRINELLKSILVSEEAGLPVRHRTLRLRDN